MNSKNYIRKISDIFDMYYWQFMSYYQKISKIEDTHDAIFYSSFYDNIYELSYDLCFAAYDALGEIQSDDEKSSDRKCANFIKILRGIRALSGFYAQNTYVYKIPEYYGTSRIDSILMDQECSYNILFNAAKEFLEDIKTALDVNVAQKIDVRLEMVYKALDKIFHTMIEKDPNLMFKM